MTLHELGHRMSVQEFRLWAAYHEDCPIGDERADLRSAITASTVANYAGRRLEDDVMRPVDDFMPRRRSALAKQGPPPEDDADPLDFFRGL